MSVGASVRLGTFRVASRGNEALASAFGQARFNWVAGGVCLFTRRRKEVFVFVLMFVSGLRVRG